MSGAVRSCSSRLIEPIKDGWEFCETAPDSVLDPAGVGHAATPWLPAAVPSTVAECLQQSGQWSIDGSPVRFDSSDWWYRTQFVTRPAFSGERVLLHLAGLATLAEVWLNGQLLLASENMFLHHETDVSVLLQERNDLSIRFRSVDSHLKARRPRPRWRTPMIENQQLRWIRTTPLGRTPGWSPPAAAVGPWRPVFLERRREVDLGNLRIRTSMRGASGCVAVSCEISPLGRNSVGSVSLILQDAGSQWSAPLVPSASGSSWGGELAIPDVRRWWPHTHGAQELYKASLRVELIGSESRHVDFELQSVGFRTVELDQSGGGFAIRVNGERVFCRGACWTPLDCVSLRSSLHEYEQMLALVRESGMNMVRVGGMMVYETADFFDACNRAGILVWQDFMFSNMDYPADDAAFLALATREAQQHAQSWGAHPCVALICGNSEVSQQAAMAGADRDLWSPNLFTHLLQDVALEHCPDVPYWPSSAYGGAFPHQASAGATSYYGVGAYQRPLTDARDSDVRFASECLAFANIPEPDTLKALSTGTGIRCHHPRWKERVPRDLGAGWDFDDIRDFYVSKLYNTDPTQLRYYDHDRYLRLGRAASGEVISATIRAWRQSGSRCGGGLVWFLRDFWPGAGWGLVDSFGGAKAALHMFRRAAQPTSASISDEGVNGLLLHLENEAAKPFTGLIELRLFLHSASVDQPVSRQVEIPARSTITLPVTDLYSGFSDFSFAYRFGSPTFDLMHLALKTADSKLIAEDWYFPLGLPNQQHADIGLVATAEQCGESEFKVRIDTRKFAQSVHLEVPGYRADDQYFHMLPQTSRTVRLSARGDMRVSRFGGSVYSLNSGTPSLIRAAS